MKDYEVKFKVTPNALRVKEIAVTVTAFNPEEAFNTGRNVLWHMERMLSGEHEVREV
jgi:hypothetical protein